MSMFSPKLVIEVKLLYRLKMLFKNAWSQAQIMKLSNLLLGWGSKLRIKEHDQLDACVKSVPEWESEAIMPLGSHQMTQI